MHPVTIRTEPARRLIGLPHKGAYEEIGRSFEAFFALCQSRNLWSDLRASLAVYMDNPDTVATDELRSFAGADYVGQDTPEGMDEVRLEGGKTAVLTYKAPYSGIPAAYDSFYGNWLPQSGEEPADAPCFEVYLNDPREVAPEELLTEICMPLK